MNRLLRRVADSKRCMAAFKLISTVASIGSSLIFILQLALLLTDGEYITFIKVGSVAAVGFVIVTVARRIINAPRPYELRDFYKVSPREKSGESFPSRHAYSAFVIATLAWLLHPAASISAAVLGIVISLARYLTGIHFLRDLAAGALIGVLSGVIGILIIL